MTTRTLPKRRASTSAVPSRETADWRTRSACATEDPEIFFPVGSTEEALDQTEKALRTCFSCPVIDDCLRWALETGQNVGVLGGLTEQDRRRMRRAKPRTVVSAVADGGLRAPDPTAVEDYVRGELVAVDPIDRLAAIVEGTRRGMTYREFDRKHHLSRHSTSTFISRMRKSYAERGLDFPDMAHRAGLRGLTNEQVVAARERYAAGGVTDTDLAMSFGVARKTMTCLLNGRSYRDVPGPIREIRKSGPAEASRVLWAGKRASSVVLESDMGEAA